jgi:hypothetical protein
MGAKLTTEERFVWYVVCPQSFSGLVMSGLFYAWGALNESINKVSIRVRVRARTRARIKARVRFRIIVHV